MKRFFIIACVVVAAALAGWAGWHSFSSAPLPAPGAAPMAVPAKVLSSSASMPALLPVASTTLVVFDGTKNIVNSAVPVAATSTVFSVVKAAAANTGLAFDYKVYPGTGILITEIGDKINGAGGAYWQYWVNGAYATEGADHATVHAGDRIEWKFTASQQ